MNAKQRNTYIARAQIMKALAHPARLMIVDKLGKKPRCVCEIRNWIGSDISTVSKHLAVLNNAGIVAYERRGLQIFYRLCCPCVANFITCAETTLKTGVKKQARLIRKA
jgi:DNA-binding transcriptional ArsR family regulator